MAFRNAKSASSLRLYSLPRRELQALCKRHGIPANKTNVKMADALSAVMPLGDLAKSKAWAGTNALGVSKTTPMKLKADRKTGLPETSLASLILNGKAKVTPVKARVVVVDAEDVSFPKPNTTPLRRGMKRTERPMETVQEEKVVSAVPIFTRAAAAALHDGTSVNSPKVRVSTPRNRTAEIVTRRGGDALPPVSFSDLLSTPKRSEPPAVDVIQLTSTGRTAKKMKSRLGAVRTSPQEEEAKTLPVSSVHRGKKVTFAEEVQFENTCAKKAEDPNPASHHGDELEPETETIEVSYAEIELKNTSLHRELLGAGRTSPVVQESDVAAVPKEPEQMEGAGFEYRNMALHKELFGSKSETNNEARTSAHAIDGEASDLGIFLDCPFASSPEGLDYCNMALNQDRTPLSSIPENATDESDIKVEEFGERGQIPKLQGRDLSPLLNDIPSDVPAESPSEKDIGLPVFRDAQPTECPFNEPQEIFTSPFVQELSAVSPCADIPLVFEEDIEQIQQLRDDRTDDTVVGVEDIFANVETTKVHSSLVLGEGQIVHTCPTPQSAEVRRSPLRRSLPDKNEPNASSSAEVVITAGSKPMMPGSSAFNIPETSSTNIENSSESPRSRSIAEFQSNIQSTLAKATLLLEKVAAIRADAERKEREGYWEPKFSSSVVETDSQVAVPVAKLAASSWDLAQAALADKDLPSAKKARSTPKVTSGSEDGLVVCEDAEILSSVENPSVMTRISDVSRDSSEVSDKENLGEKIIGGKNSRKFGVEKRKGKKFEVLKDRSKNVIYHTGAENTKAGTGQVCLEDMSLRKLRAQVKEKVTQLQNHKVSDPQTQRSWN